MREEARQSLEDSVFPGRAWEQGNKEDSVFTGRAWEQGSKEQRNFQ